MINRFKSKRNFLVIMFGESLKVPKLNKITSLKNFKIRNNCDDDTLPLINNLKLADSSSSRSVHSPILDQVLSQQFRKANSFLHCLKSSQNDQNWIEYKIVKVVKCEWVSPKLEGCLQG